MDAGRKSTENGVAFAPELSVPPGLVDDHDAAGRVRDVSRDGVDGESAVVEACLLSGVVRTTSHRIKSNRRGGGRR